MSTEPAIRVDRLSKKFARSLKRAMWYGLVDISRAALVPRAVRSRNLAARITDAARTEAGAGMPPAEPASGLRPTEFWALRDISFELRRGECMGVVGHNGAGKSTLFSILSGIYGPTEGRVEIRGRLQALIALGAGFHPALTGRENIYINASMFGLTQRQIDALFQDVVDFSELGEFIDMPIKNYSSGMYVRLGFSVAIHLQPEILLVDEVLSVGDIAFQNKSFRRMRQLIDSGVPVLFVSHYAQAIESVCNRAMWLDHGRLKQIGGVTEVINAYTDAMNLRRAQEVSSQVERDDTRAIQITSVSLADDAGRPAQEIAWGRHLVVRLAYEARLEVPHPYFTIMLARVTDRILDFATCSMCDDGLEWDVPAGAGSMECVIDTRRLCPGVYALKCGIIRNKTARVGQPYYHDYFEAARFVVTGTAEGIGRPGLMSSLLWYAPPVLIDHTWQRKT